VPKRSSVVHSLPAVDVSYVKEIQASEVGKRQYSTLDLSGLNSFSFLVGSRMAREGRVEVLKEALKALPVDVKVHGVDEDLEFMAEKHARMFENGADFRDGDGLLVRFDKHILMRIGINEEIYRINDVMLNHLGFTTDSR
jgi:hypothetical protein